MKTFTAAELDEVVDAYFDSFDMLAQLPGTRIERAPRGTCLVASGMLTPTTNGVCSPRRTPVMDEVATLSAAMSEIGVPWSIQTRGEPVQSVLDVAASHGLTGRIELPLMVVDQADFVTRPAGDGTAVVHVAGVGRREEFLRVFTEGFGIPLEVLGPLALPEIFNMPDYTSYVLEVDGEPVACGAALFSRGRVCVSNITTLAEHRGRGYGRLVTEAAADGGFAAGAHTAYLFASPDGLPLYESMGFRTVEDWSFLIADAPQE
jgi:N-acetylglutamate synthase